MPERHRSGKRPNIPAAIRREVLREGSCAYCGESFFSLTVDHIVPFSRGGDDGRKNLTAACGPCNKEKLDFTPDEWKAWRLEMGHPWPPRSRSAFIAEQIKAHWPQHIAEKAVEEAALSNQPAPNGGEVMSPIAVPVSHTNDRAL